MREVHLDYMHERNQLDLTFMQIIKLIVFAWNKVVRVNHVNRRIGYYEMLEETHVIHRFNKGVCATRYLSCVSQMPFV